MNIKFILQEHGWLDIYIFEEERELYIPAAYLSDSIREMIISLSIFLEGNQDVIFKFETEPGEYRFRIKSEGSNNITLFEVYEFKDIFSKDDLEKGQPIISTRVESKRLINKFYREISKLKEIEKDEFKNRWGYDFPQDAFDRLIKAKKIWGK